MSDTNTTKKTKDLGSKLTVNYWGHTVYTELGVLARIQEALGQSNNDQQAPIIVLEETVAPFKEANEVQELAPVASDVNIKMLGCTIFKGNLSIDFKYKDFEGTLPIQVVQLDERNEIVLNKQVEGKKRFGQPMNLQDIGVKVGLKTSVIIRETTFEFGI